MIRFIRHHRQLFSFSFPFLSPPPAFSPPPSPFHPQRLWFSASSISSSENNRPFPLLPRLLFLDLLIFRFLLLFLLLPSLLLYFPSIRPWPDSWFIMCQIQTVAISFKNSVWLSVYGCIWLTFCPSGWLSDWLHVVARQNIFICGF